MVIHRVGHGVRKGHAADVPAVLINVYRPLHVAGACVEFTFLIHHALTHCYGGTSGNSLGLVLSGSCVGDFDIAGGRVNCVQVWICAIGDDIHLTRCQRRKACNGKTAGLCIVSGFLLVGIFQLILTLLSTLLNFHRVRHTTTHCGRPLVDGQISPIVLDHPISRVVHKLVCNGNGSIATVGTFVRPYL